MSSDEELMLSCGRGDRDAMAQLFGRYQQPIWAFFRRRLRDRARAEELAQDVFVALLKNAGRYRPDALFRAYLFGIAFNLLAAERRRPAPVPEVPDAPEASSARPDVADVLAVRGAVEKLDARDREIVMLREFEQLTYEEIARVLEIPINTVRSRLFRARLELRTWLSTPIQKM